MKSASDTFSLDNFIKGTLKSTDPDLQPFDWSEITVLLRHEQKPISVLESKKLLFISGIFAATLIIGFGIFELVQYYTSLPDSAEKISAPVQPLVKKTTDSSASVIKTAKIGSAFVDDDTSAEVTASEPDTIKVRKVVTPVEKPIQKQEKKKKQDTMPLSTLEIPAEKTPIEIPPPVDTSSKQPIQEIKEIKNETPSEVDTIHKKFSLWPKKSRNKK